MTGKTGLTAPVGTAERHPILDVLRGIALLGICTANFPEFSLYTFQKKAVTASMPTAAVDHAIRYLQYIFVDGKFYTLFSLLFGIGFSIIISNAMKKNRSGLAVFYRRTAILAVIGLVHLMLIWSGDILLLYALLGMLLPLFLKMPDRKLILFAVLLLFFPVVMDSFKDMTGNRYDLEAPVVRATQYFNAQSGITDDNFGVWLRDGKGYADVLKFLLSGAFIRCQEFIEGNRVFKVLGLFLLGLYIGRNRMYARLETHRRLLGKIRLYGFLTGLPVSCLYAWSAMNDHPAGFAVRSLAYFVSVVPMSLAYVATVCLWYMRNRELRLFRYLAAPGRMALSNYIGQSVAGILIFYGVGLGLGATMGLVHVEMIAVGVFALQVAASCVWMKYFQFGPLEWVWRMLTYKTRLKLKIT
jgi:uncharacterized protein